LLPHLPSLFSAEVSHIQGSFEATGGHVAFSCSVNLPYEPVKKAAKKAAETAKSKALALRDYMTKPPPKKPTKRITPEFVSSSPQETEPYAEPEPEPEKELTEEERDEILTTLGSANNPIYWEATCPDDMHNDIEDAFLISIFVKELDWENKLMKPLANMSRKEAIDRLVLPALQAPCESLRISLKCYHQTPRNHQETAIDAVVLYRRHSPQVKPHLRDDTVDFFEGMCNYLLCLLRNAGYHVTHTAPQ